MAIQINIRLDDSESLYLSQESKKLGLTNSAFIRLLLNMHKESLSFQASEKQRAVMPLESTKEKKMGQESTPKEQKRNIETPTFKTYFK